MAILQSARDKIKRTKPGEIVDLNDYSFFDSDVDELIELFKQQKHTKISIRTSNITNMGAIKLASYTDLVYISLDENSIGDMGVQALLSLPRLRELHLCTNDLTDKGASLIKDRCGQNFRASIDGNVRVSKTLIQEINAMWVEYKPEISKFSSESKGTGYSPSQWQRAADSSASSSSASSAEDMTRTASDSPKQATEKPSSGK